MRLVDHHRPPAVPFTTASGLLIGRAFRCPPSMTHGEERLQALLLAPLPAARPNPLMVFLRRLMS